tara:strand:- start:146 stop:625 length:480 start_codon:yes stop_codon:yes gene_type:complete
MILQREPGSEFYSLNNRLRAIVIVATVFPVKDSTFTWLVDTKVLRSIWREYKQVFIKDQTMNIMYGGGLDLATRGQGVELEDYSHEQLRAMVDYHLDTHPEMSNDEHDRYEVICRMMDRPDPKAHLRKLMNILDSHQEEMPEGVYIEMSAEIMRLWNAI